MTENSVQELQRAIVKNKRDILNQFNQVNLDNSQQLSTTCQLQTHVSKVESRCLQMEKDLQKGLLKAQLQPADDNSEYYEKRFQQIQEQITYISNE